MARRFSLVGKNETVRVGAVALLVIGAHVAVFLTWPVGGYGSFRDAGPTLGDLMRDRISARPFAYVAES